MSMLRKIFRPGKGQVHQRFVAAFMNGAASFRGDLVIWDVEAPTAQGASGVIDGQTLGTDDFIFVEIESTAADKVGLQAGIVAGPTVGSSNSVTAIPNDGIVIVQTFGIHPTVFCEDATVAIGAMLTTESAQAGSVADITIAAAIGTDAVVGGNAMVGMALTTDFTFTRGTVTEECCVGLVRCDF